ncbi:hypothetical protein FRC14_008043 [Serendipita sp. 396]|nr:hypothetical protein FRC14_008043 [Serendipita sp. 396]KAG8779378.1 hypothetical protein FRC15_010222 [Serendipita sp. 397]KAG8795887.1 hypothetical protein FRC16_009907 [Serendipita sp. 398]KAG8866232.1 hypothetical protein FRC20_008930 [Serendipita sp. 405]
MPSKQPSKQPRQPAQEQMDLSDNSGSGDELGTEQEREPSKPTYKKAKQSKTSAETVPSKPAGKSSKDVKGKGRAKADTDAEKDDMDVDTENAQSRKRSANGLYTPNNMDVKHLAEENERLVRRLEEMSNRYNNLQRMRDQLVQDKDAEKTQAALYKRIDSLQKLDKQRSELLSFRNSEYTKSKLIQQDPKDVVEFVTIDWADRYRAEGMEDVQTENTDLAKRLKASEAAREELQKKVARQQGELAQLREELKLTQKELEVEVTNSKKLQAEAGRRPAASSQPPIVAGAPKGVVHELENKVDLLENLSGVSIINYTESIRQPGNVKSITYTCLLRLEDREFPFKLVVWDQGAGDQSQEAEHVVYSPGEPMDPDIELDYLASSFTFPRSQIMVFYQNMLGILTTSREEEDDA